jgi:hypothetical protein
MIRCSERQRLRPRVPDTPRIAVARALPFLHAPARIGWHAPQSRPQITTSLPHRIAKEPKASPKITSTA